MRIAVVCGDDVFFRDDLPEGRQDELCGQFCAALASHGHDVTAYQRRRGMNPGGANASYRTVTTCAGPNTSMFPREVLPFVGDWAAELDRLWSASPPDVVHAFGWLGGLAAQLAARQHHFPTVQSFYGLASTSGPARHDDDERARLEPLLARNATRVTGGSTDEVHTIARLRRTRAHVSVLSTGVDMERYTPTGPKQPGSGLHRVLQVEPDLQPHNGFDNTIQALPKLPETELVIAETVGAISRPNHHRAGLQRLATELGVADRVRFMGNVAPEDLPSLLRSADVVACTPRQAPQATTALQAMASGVVVVGVAVGALIDTVVSGVTGLLVSPNSPQELPAALNTLQAQTFRRESMASSGRSRARSRFTWARIALDALNLYHQACSPDLPQRRGTAGRAKNAALA